MYCFRIIKVKESLTDEDADHLSHHFTFGSIEHRFVIITSFLISLSELLSKFRLLLVRGPKGSGKSYSLLYLACTAEQHQKFVLISPHTTNLELTQRLDLLTGNESREERSEDSNIMILKNLSVTLKERLLILVDMGTLSTLKSEYIAKITKVINSAFRSKVVIALSSGMGAFISSKSRNFWQRLFESADSVCEFSHFGRKEVKLYMRTYSLIVAGKINKDEIKRKMANVKVLTHYNPYLINLYTKHELNFHTMASAYIRNHLESVLISSKTRKHLEKSREAYIQDLYKWAVICDNHVKCDIEELCKFKESFSCQVGLFYFQKINAQQYTVCCTFPCLFTLINEVLCDSLSQDQLSNIPIVQGFLYEDHFFSAFMRTAYFKVKTTDGYASFSFIGSLVHLL